MQLTKAFEQGVCVMAMLTTQPVGVPLGSQSIHKHLGTSATYIQKIVRKLVVSGLVTSVSGQRGGFMLAKPANEISYLDVVEAIEGPVETFPTTNLIDRVLGDTVDGDTVNKADSALHKSFNLADQAWRQVLAKTTLQDLVYESLNGEEIRPTDWNNESSRNSLLVRKLLKGGEKA
jgi:Rrf2 family protein